MDKTANHDASHDFHDAINKLEAYVLDTSDAPFATASRTISMMRSLFISSFDINPKRRKHDKRPPDHETVLRAVEFINRHRFYIEQLKEGSQAERELAASLTQKIEAYNKSCDRRIQNCIISNTGISGLIFGKGKGNVDIPPKISLPQKVTIKKHYPEKPSLQVDAEKSALKGTTSEPISIPKQSAELFQMKALSLLEQYGIASNPEARAHVKVSPILALAESDDSTCTLTQTFTLFPGQTIVVKGSSALDPRNKTISKLFPETFCLSLESTQTGFPHPSQRTGWALSHHLLPENPQRIDMLGTTAQLLRRRAHAISGLLPQGDLLKKAKELLGKKKQCFKIHRNRLIDVHHKLATTIATAAPAADNKTKETIDRFYSTLASHPHPFEHLTETNNEIRDAFIAKPYELLISTILRGKSTGMSQNDPAKRYELVHRTLEEHLNNAYGEILRHIQEELSNDERDRWEYILHFGKLIGNASKQIILQYLSEDIVYPPPILSKFESMLQGVAFNHLDGFLSELESAIPMSMLEKLEHDITEDIKLFTGEKISPHSKELQGYFEARYTSLKEFYL